MWVVAGERLVLDGNPPFGERLDTPWFRILPYIQSNEKELLRVSVFRPHVGISREFLAGQPIEASSFAINSHFPEELGIHFLQASFHGWIHLDLPLFLVDIRSLSLDGERCHPGDLSRFASGEA